MWILAGKRGKEKTKKKKMKKESCGVSCVWVVVLTAVFFAWKSKYVCVSECGDVVVHVSLHSRLSSNAINGI